MLHLHQTPAGQLTHQGRLLSLCALRRSPMATPCPRNHKHAFSTCQHPVILRSYFLSVILFAHVAALSASASSFTSRHGHNTVRVTGLEPLGTKMPTNLASRRALQQPSDASSAMAAIQPVQAHVRTGNATAPPPELSPAGSSSAPNPPRVDVVKKVSSAEQLFQAMEQGAFHILITAHMDLYHLPAKQLVAIPSTVTLRVCYSKICPFEGCF